jgi:GntR family transcriptional regulator
MLAVDWYPATLAAAVPSLLSTAPGKAGRVLTDITEATGRTVNSGRDAVKARTSDEREASRLGIKHGAPVLAGAHSWSDDQGLIVFGEWVLPEEIDIGWTYEMQQ